MAAVLTRALAFKVFHLCSSKDYWGCGRKASRISSVVVAALKGSAMEGAGEAMLELLQCMAQSVLQLGV